MGYGVDSLIAVAIALPLLGILAVVLRFYVRLHLKRDYVGVDDWLILASIVLVCGQAAIQILAAKNGELGRDADPIDTQRTAYQSKLDKSVLVIEKVTYAFIKLSVLFFYRRIFGLHEKFRLANDVLIILIIVWGLVFLFTGAFLCGSESSHGHPCAPSEWGVLWFAITDVLGDAAILALPYPCIRKLQMRRRDRWGLAAVFMLGILSLIVGVVRLGFVAETFAIYFHPAARPNSRNRTPPNMWTIVEVSIGVFAACLPALRPLLGHVPGPKSLYGRLLRTRPSDNGKKTEGNTARTNSESRKKSEAVPMDVQRGRGEEWDERTSKAEGRSNRSVSADREMELRDVV